MTKVLVTGATGFIALETVKQLLEKGYTVVGTVRSQEKGDKIASLLNTSRFSYTIVEDISKLGAFDDFVKNHQDATVFIHTASPVKYTGDIETELLRPALNGTLSVLQAIKKYGPNIVRLVITSSFVALTSYADAADPKVTLNEDSWNGITWEEGLKDNRNGYAASKTFAERTAWKFVEDEKPLFTLTTVQPTFVFGPQPFDELVTNDMNVSAEILNQYLKIKSPNDDYPKYTTGAVDVRDVAAAHIVGFEKEEAKNQRLLLLAGPFTEQTILDLLHQRFPEQSKHLPVGVPGSDKKEMYNQANINTDRTQKILGFPLISIEQSIVDSFDQIFKLRK